MSTDRWLVKLDCSDPSRFDPEAHIPVFHRWIQQKKLPLVLIDVADYAHVVDGPGVLLVSHEYNIFADRFDGRPGLSVQRKLRGGVGAESLVDTLRVGLLAVQALAAEASLPGSRFRLDEVEIVANDRLRAPNSDDGWKALEPVVQDAARRLYDGTASVSRTVTPSGERLTARIGGGGGEVAALLQRLQA